MTWIHKVGYQDLACGCRVMDAPIGKSARRGDLVCKTCTSCWVHDIHFAKYDEWFVDPLFGDNWCCKTSSFTKTSILLYIFILSTSLKDLQPGFETIWYENTTYLHLTHVYSLIWNLLFTWFYHIIHPPFSWNLCFWRTISQTWNPEEAAESANLNEVDQLKAERLKTWTKEMGLPRLVRWSLRLFKICFFKAWFFGRRSLCIIGWCDIHQILGGNIYCNLR